MESINMFGGMNSDLSSFIQNTEKYLKALNVRPVTDLGESNGALTNVRGNNCEIQFPTLKAVYRFTITTTAAIPITNTAVTITINSITSDPFTISSFASITDVVNAIKGMSNCYNNPGASNPTFAIAYDDDYFTIYQNPSHTLCSNSDGISPTITVNQGGGSADRFFISYVNTSDAKIAMTANPANTPLPFINAVTSYSLAIIGSTYIEGNFYLFTVPTTNPTAIGQIWSLTYSPVSTNDSAFTTKLKLLYNNYLNFSIDYPIAPTAVIGRYELPSIQRIYWSDFNNYVRVCNVVDENLMVVDPKTINIIPQTILTVPTLKKITSNNAVNVLNNLSNYQCVYKYFKSNGGQTNFSIPSNIVTLTKDPISSFMGTSPKYCSLNGSENLINKTITWEINEVDNNYDTIKFYIIINNSGTFKIYEYDEQVIGDVSSLETTFRNDAALMIEIPLSEFLIENNSFTSAKTIEQKDNRLFFGNVKNSFESLVSDFDARTYRYRNEAGLYDQTAIKLMESNVVTYPNLNSGNYSTIDKKADIIPAYNLGMSPIDDPNYGVNFLYKWQINYDSPNTLTPKIGGTGPNISYEFGNELFASDQTTTFPAYDQQAKTGTDKDLESSFQSYKNGYRRAGTKNDTACSFNPFFKNISPNNSKFDQKYYTGNVDGQGGAKNTIGHDYLSGNFRTYERNEIYRFAIVFKSKSGYSSFAKFIGDIKFPDYDDPCPVENRAKVAGANNTCPDFRRMWLEDANNSGINPKTAYSVVPYIKFNVNISKELADLISGYEIVRVQRKDQDKTIATTGIINQVSEIKGGDHGHLRMGTSTSLSPWEYLQDPLTVPGAFGSLNSRAHPYIISYHPFENLCNSNNNLITSGDRLIPTDGYIQTNVGRTNPSEVEFSSPNNASYYIKKFYERRIPNPSKMDKTIDGNQFIIFNSEYITTGAESANTYYSMKYVNKNFYPEVGEENNWYENSSSSGSPTILIGLQDGINVIPVVGQPQTNATPIVFQDFLIFGEFAAANTGLYATKGKLFVSHFKPSNLKTQYGGRTYIARSSNEYISTGALRKIDDLNFDTVNSNGSKTYSIKTFGGDVFFGILDIQKAIKRWTYQGDVPFDYKHSQTWFLPYTSTYNLDLRHGNHINFSLNSDSDVAAGGIDEYSYNTTYSNENNLKTYFAEPFIFNETTVFKNRIYWSSVKINGFTSDQWTNIPTNNFYDVDGNYGGINALITLGQNMFFLQNNAFGRLLINPVSVMTDANSSQLRLTNILGDSTTLDKHFYYSVNIGTQHQWSVAKSGSAITFCDINSNKLYLFNGESLDPISDSKGHRGFMNKVLHNRIRITDNPIKYNGILSTYDFKNNEFLYTFLNKGYITIGLEASLYDEKYTLAYSDLIQQFSSFYSFTPYIYINNNSIFYSPENYTVGSSVRAKAYLHNEGAYGSFYGTVYPSEVKVLVNANPSVTKAFDNLSWQTQSTKINYTYYDEINNAFASITGYDSDNQIYQTDTYSKIRVYNQSQNTDWITTSLTPITGNLRKLEKSFNMQAPRNKYNNNGSSIFDPAALTISSFGDRLRDKFITVDLSYPNSLNNRFIMHNLKTSYRVSDR
jgi:hypothetical protein